MRFYPLILAAVIALVVATAPFNHAAAQDGTGKTVPTFTPGPDAGTLTAPDWGMASKTPNKTNDPHFYQRCLQGADTRIPANDRRDMCACMDAKQIKIGQSTQNDNWLTTIGAQHTTPYESFVTQVFAPCMYLEGFALGARECYTNWQFRDMFPDEGSFDDYCTCYANAAEHYIQQYAQPLLASKLADPITHDRSVNIDPARVVMESTDYIMYMYHQRQRCTRIYGYHVNE